MVKSQASTEETILAQMLEIFSLSAIALFRPTAKHQLCHVPLDAGIGGQEV
jgi:hypothetical protein